MPTFENTGRMRNPRKDTDGYKALAAGVILRAQKDYTAPSKGYCDGLSPLQVKCNAARFLQGDMEPFASVLGMDAETDLSHRRWCRAHGLVAGSLIGEPV